MGVTNNYLIVINIEKNLNSYDHFDPSLTFYPIFNINISQLVGEIPLNFSEVLVPILRWENINIKLATVNFQIDSDTKFIAVSLSNADSLFALHVEHHISEKYCTNDLMVFEQTLEYVNNDEVLLSINRSSPVIKKYIKEGDSVYLKSVSNNIPAQVYDPTNTVIFGVLREVRIRKFF